MNRLIVIYDATVEGQSPEAPVLIWRRIEDGNWLGPPEQGSLTELATAQSNYHSEIWLAVASPEIVMVAAHFESGERSHLAKLMPYELEEQILGNVDDFHFAYGAIHGDQVSVAYTPREWIAELLQQFENLNLEVAVCLPLPLLLPYNEHQWSLRWLGGDNSVEVRYGHDLAFTVPMELLQDSLLALNSELDAEQHPQQIKLFGESFEDLQTLQENLPESLQEIATSAQWDQWLSLSVELVPALNLRQQSLGRSLPLARWWQAWKPAAIVAGVSVVLFLVGNYVAVSQLKSQQKNHIAAYEKAYRSVVPQGQMVDPVQQLSTKLKEFKSDSGDSDGGVIGLMAAVSPVIANSEEISLRNLHFVDGEMRLNVESSDFRQIEQMRGELEKQRLVAELLGTSSVAEGVQARLRLRSAQ